MKEALDKKIYKQYKKIVNKKTADVNQNQSDVIYDFIYVDQEGFNQYRPKSFSELENSFKEYK